MRDISGKCLHPIIKPVERYIGMRAGKRFGNTLKTGEPGIGRARRSADEGRARTAAQLQRPGSGGRGERRGEQDRIHSGPKAFDRLEQPDPPAMEEVNGLFLRGDLTFCQIIFGQIIRGQIIR